MPPDLQENRLTDDDWRRAWQKRRWVLQRARETYNAEFQLVAAWGYMPRDPQVDGIRDSNKTFRRRYMAWRDCILWTAVWLRG